MKYAANGSVLVTTTKNLPGLFSKDGYTQVTDVTATPDVICGLYADDGSLNVTILTNELTRVPALAPNGSVYIVDGAGDGLYSPCGAMNVSFDSAPVVIPLSLSMVDSEVSSADLTTYTFSGQTLGAGQIIIAGSVRAGVVFSLSSVTVAGQACTIDVQSSSSNTLTFIAHVAGNVAATGDVVVTLSAAAARCGISVYLATGLTQANPYLTGQGIRNSSVGVVDASLTGAIDTGFVVACGFNGQTPGHRHTSGSVSTVPGTNRTVSVNMAASSCTWTGVTEDVDVQLEGVGTTSGQTAVSAAFK